MARNRIGYRESNGLGYYDHTTALTPAAPEVVARRMAWLAAYRRLPLAQQDAWQRLPGRERDRTKELTAEEFVALMDRIAPQQSAA